MIMVGASLEDAWAVRGTPSRRDATAALDERDGGIEAPISR
jgi:hypothetical protein